MPGPRRSDHDGVVRLRRLLEAGRALRSGEDLAALLGRTVETAREVTGARYAAVGVLDDSRTALSHFVTSPVGSGAGVRRRLLERARPTPVGVSRAPRSYGAAIGEPGDHGFLGAAITIRGQTRGSFYLSDKQGKDDFDDDDVDSLTVLADWAGVAIDYAGLAAESIARRDELERARRTLRTALEIATSVGSDTDLDSVLELIVQRARALVDADSLLIWLREREQLRIAAVAGAAGVRRGAVVPLRGSTAGEVLRAGRSLRVADARQMLTAPAEFGMSRARSALIVPLTHRGRGLGVLMAFDRLGTTSTFDAANERALVAFAASAATAVATARLVEEQRLQESIDASDVERARWARELHDETLQGLASLKITLAGALKLEPARSRTLLEAAATHLDHDIAALRAIINDLRPAALDELGLEPALRTLVATVTEAATLRSRVSIAIASRLPPDVETIAYRVAQESLTNVVRHAEATNVAVEVRVADGRLRLTVTDDGRGVTTTPGPGRGVVGMRERAALASGTLVVGSGPSGGTRVALDLPLD